MTTVLQAMSGKLVSLVVPELRASAAACDPGWETCCCQCRSNDRYQCWRYFRSGDCSTCCGRWVDQGFRCR